MKFSLTFYAMNNWKEFLDVGIDIPIGTEGVKKIQKELRCELNIERIEPFYKRFNSMSHIKGYMNLFDAEYAGVYNTENVHSVDVIGNNLERVVDEIVGYDKDSQTGEIKSAWLEYRINFDQLVSYWKADGFPEKLEINHAV